MNDHKFMLEDEIERRGLQGPYMEALMQTIGIERIALICELECIQYEHVAPELWKLLRATPEQRDRAFLVATE